MSEGSEGDTRPKMFEGLTFHVGDDHARLTTTVGGEPVEITVHPSTIHPGCLNVEIDGELHGRLRIHMNDRLIVDTLLDVPELPDPRDDEGDLEDDGA